MTSRMWRAVGVIGSVVALTVGLSACGGQSEQAGGDAAQPVEISYGVWDSSQQPAMQQIIDAFEAKNPTIKVRIEFTPNKDYWTKLQTAATSGTAPDVFWMNGPRFPLYASEGILEPLDSLKGSGDGQVDTSNYPQSLVDLYSYNGTLFGVPKDFDTVGLWYNKKMFDAAGLDYPDRTWTWDTVKQAAKKLTDKDKGVWGIEAYFASQEAYYDSIAQAGGYVISPDGKSSGYDTPEGIAGISYWADFIKDGTSPSLAQMQDADPDNMGVLLQSGKVAMLPAASYMANDLLKSDEGKNLDVAWYPKGVKDATIIHGLGNVVYAKGQHKDAAMKFAAFLGSKEAADIQAKAGTVLPAFNNTQQTWVDAHPGTNVQVFVDMLSVSVPYPVSKNTAAWASQEQDFLSKAWSLEETPEVACKQMADAMNAALAEEQ